jgi:biopolymer transport protein ExbD
VAADLEPPPPKPHEDETRLDMNPLIDVALVLLIFFILTTSYAALQKVIDMPGASAKDDRPLRVVPRAKIDEAMIRVEARMKGDKKVIKVENTEVDEKFLRANLAKYVKDTRKTNLLIDAQGIDLGTLVAIQDAAKGAGFQMIYYASKNPSPP